MDALGKTSHASREPGRGFHRDRYKTIIIFIGYDDLLVVAGPDGLGLQRSACAVGRNQEDLTRQTLYADLRVQLNQSAHPLQVTLGSSTNGLGSMMLK